MTKARIPVALTDDHVIVRKGFKDIISSYEDFEVIIEADNGEELLEKLAITQPAICILDISMPKKNGYETVTEIKKLYPWIKILVLTMFNNEFAMLRMLRCGANGYLLKNCHPNDLKVALHTLNNNGYYHSDFITGRVIVQSMDDNQIVSPKISDKETQFLELCCRDINYKQIAELLNVSPRTVEGYRDALFRKLNIKTRSALAMYAIQVGLVPL